MKQIRRTLHVDPISGYCGDGTNMWDWSVDRLKQVLDYCWDADIADLAKRILQHQKEQLEKIIDK